MPMFSRLPFGVDPFSGGATHRSIAAVGATGGVGCCCGSEPPVNFCGCVLPAILYGTISASTCPNIPNGTIITFYLNGHPNDPLWHALFPTGAGDPDETLVFLLGCGAQCPAPGNCSGTEPPYVPNTWCLLIGCQDTGSAYVNECVLEGYVCSPAMLVFDHLGGDGGSCSAYGSGSCTFRITLTP